MGALHRQIEKLKLDQALLLATIKDLPAAHSHRFEGRPDHHDNTEGAEMVPVCVEGCPACQKEKILNQFGVADAA